METIETLNRRLSDIYGNYLDGQPLYRIVYSENEMEKRLISTTDEGFTLLTPVVKEVPKYRQYIQNKHILERLIEIPNIYQNEMLSKLSYEPIWVFEDRHGNPLPPVWPVIERIITTVLQNAAMAVGKKYRDPREDEFDPKIALEVRDDRLRKLELEMFGNETPVGDALAHKTGVTVPEIPTSKGL